MDDYLRCICHNQGAFLRREALALGYDQKVITRLVRNGAWHRVRHGAYTFPDIWRRLTDLDRHRVLTRAAIKSARTGVVASHVSAAVELTDRVWDLDLTEVDLTRLDRRTGRREAGVRQHRGLLLPGDIMETDGIPRRVRRRQRWT